MDRVYYHSKSDLATGYYLEKAELRIREIENAVMPSDLEGVIELWHIYRMLKDDCRLQRWTEETFLYLKKSTDSYNSVVASFFISMDPLTVKDLYDKLEWGYRKSFWQIVSQFKCYNNIRHDVIRSIISENINDLRSVLMNEFLVEKYKGVIREVLLECKLGAQIILDKYVSKPKGNDKIKIFLPSNLTVQEKECIVSRYLDNEDPNINYVRLIVQAKDVSGHFVLSAKTRYKAEKLAKRLNEELMRDPRTTITHFQQKIEFSDDSNVEVYSYSNEQGSPHFIYSRKYILACNNEGRVAFFSRAFNWFNQQLLLNLINKNTEVNGLEKVLIDKGRDAYPAFQVFQYKNNLAIHQTYGYSQVLKQAGSSLENELRTFYEQKLKEVFGYPSLSIKLPKNEDDWLAKCRILFPELDNLARQYNTYVDEDEIDSEYLLLLKPMKMTTAKSLLINKYLELNEENYDVKKVMYCLFNSNALLDYVDPFKDKHYNSFVDLITHESVCYANYESHQKPYIDYLIEKNIIIVNSKGDIEYVESHVIDILNSIWEYGVCSYWHLDESGRESANKMIAKKWLLFDDHLLSKAERDYFSYYTDNSEFTNGFAYRNRYAHGNTPPIEDSEAHATAYYVMIRLLTILIIKIYDDLWSAKRAFLLGTIDNINYKHG